jgi:hypothetical protein
VTGPEITVHIDRLVIETDQPVDGNAFPEALTEALQAVLRERGVPASWNRDRTRTSTVVDGWTWDGRGGMSGLASNVAARLYEEGLR